MNVIIKSGKKNWSGKEFSECAAKIYSSFDDAVAALTSCHFYEYNLAKNEYVQVDKFDKITLIPLTESLQERMLATSSIRW